MCLRHGLIAGGGKQTAPDPQLRANYVREPRRAPLAHVVSNSFGFGGSNCSLLLSKAAA
jgi:3-oxoacyl-[acyl-carrier-protein] synthase-1